MTRRSLQVPIMVLTLGGLLAAGGPTIRAQQPQRDGAPALTQGSAQHGDHGTPAAWRFRWPIGDPVRGREVFAKLECYSCHEVKGEAFPAPSGPEKVGPELSQMGPLHDPEYFAEAIINPSATIEKGKGYEASDGSSKMPSFNDSMSVQELIDLVAYLRGLKPPAKSRTGQSGTPAHQATTAGADASLTHSRLTPDREPNPRRCGGIAPVGQGCPQQTSAAGKLLSRSTRQLPIFLGVGAGRANEQDMAPPLLLSP